MLRLANLCQTEFPDVGEELKLRPRVGARLGISVYVDTGAIRMLFDVEFDHRVLKRNTHTLSVDLSNLDAAMISRG